MFTSPQPWASSLHPSFKALATQAAWGKGHTHLSHHQLPWALDEKKQCGQTYMATSLRTVPSSYSGKRQPFCLRSEHPQSVDWPGHRGPAVSEEGRSPVLHNPAKISGRLKWHWARHLSPQNQWTPNWSGEIRNETKCGGLGLKMARWPATPWGRTGRSPGNRVDQENHPLQWKGLATALCWTKTSVLRATVGTAWGQITFCKTQLPTWSLSKWPRVFSESTNLITNHPLARGKVSSTLSLSAACADANSVPLWTRSTSFWRHHQAPESHSSRDGK